MKTISSREMRILDENCSFLGLPPSLLMENAGRAVADEVSRLLGGLEGRRVVVVAGTGNNGGDGMAAARHMASRGARVSVILLGRGRNIRTGEARANWAILREMRTTVSLYEAPTPDELALAWSKAEAGSADALVDAIFGTGLRGPMRSPFSEAVELLNSAGRPVISIDVPSGLDPDTGEPSDPTVRAQLTVTLHRPKPGLLAPGARDLVGELVVADIGIPPEAELIVGPGDLRANLKPTRPPHAKKGDFGRILVVGGGPDYSGAPALTALAALRTGADLAIVAAPRPVAPVIRSFSPNLIVRSLSSDRLVSDDLPLLMELARYATSVAVGPGLGLDEATSEAVRAFLGAVKDLRPLVVDADALKALSGRPTLLYGSRAVLTPHSGELALLTGLEVPPPTDLEARMAFVKEVARKMGTTVLLKAHEDVISDGERVKVNITGNPGMTVGGTGDVLTGVVAMLLSRGLEPFEAACLGAFVNGMAGDLAVRELGYHITATDVIERIPHVLRAYEEPELGAPGL